MCHTSSSTLTSRSSMKWLIQRFPKHHGVKSAKLKWQRVCLKMTQKTKPLQGGGFVLCPIIKIENGKNTSI